MEQFQSQFERNQIDYTTKSKTLTAIWSWHFYRLCHHMLVSIKILIWSVFIFENLVEMIVYINYIFSLIKLMYYGTLFLLSMKSYLNQITLSWMVCFTYLNKGNVYRMYWFLCYKYIYLSNTYIILFLIKFKE